MPLDLLHLTVFCGSSNGTPQAQALARGLGQRLAEERITLVYGGGKRGLMGLLADSVLRDGGKVVGIIPEALKGMELAHEGLSMMHVVEDMSRRKDMMLFMADAVLALPGGLGTLDEVGEVLALRQLGLLKKPFCLLDDTGFWEPTLEQMRRMQKDGYLHGGEAAYPLMASDVTQALDRLRE